MRKSILAATTAGLVTGGIIGSVLVATAQPAPPAAPQPGMMESGPHGWAPWMRHWFAMRQRPFEPGTFALVHPAGDRQLTPADVQKIAEAFLLWNGNHSWKVVDVAPASDGAIAFGIASPEGSVIARFEIDPHSAHVTRVS